MRETPWYVTNQVPVGAGVFMLGMSILAIIYAPQHYKKKSEISYEPNNMCSLYSHPMWGSHCDVKWLEDNSEKRNTTKKWLKCEEKIKAADRNAKGFKCVQHSCFNQKYENIDPEGYCVEECPSYTIEEKDEEKDKICAINCKDDQKYYISKK